MDISAELTSVMKETIRGMVEGKDVAVAFSGGLDSGIVAAMTKEYARSVRLYTAGVEDAYDVIASRELAEILGLPWEHILISKDNLETNIREMIEVSGTDNPITLSFEIPLFYVSKNIGEKYIIGGQGADELFAGYSKYIGLSEDALRDQMEADMISLLTDTLSHERSVSEHFGKTILYPYLDKRVIDVVKTMDMKDLVPGEIRKETLRKVAEMIGQPEIAAKKKKAAQYGSGAMSLFRKIAKKKGITVSEFIAGTCNDIHQ
ncbi:MAG: asparagine synthase-related protein [Candidatus Methanomethylophilaceae archaeon]